MLRKSMTMLLIKSKAAPTATAAVCVLVLAVVACLVTRRGGGVASSPATTMTPPLSPRAAHTYRILVSAQCKAYQDWQSLACYWAARKNWPAATFTRLMSCTETQYPFDFVVPTVYVRDWEHHPVTGDNYAPYNRPVGLVEHMASVTEDVVVIVDPDMLIRKPLDSIAVSKGRPVAQLYNYMDFSFLTPQDKERLGNPQPIGAPYIIHRDDLARLAPLWLSMTEKVRSRFTKEAGWIAEMYGYSMAAAQLGLRHVVMDDMSARPPFTCTPDPYVLHFDIKITSGSEFSWDKRSYKTADIISQRKLMPLPPAGESSTNPLMIEVFTTINEALEHAI